jgi:hypothetical protein
MRSSCLVLLALFVATPSYSQQTPQASASPLLNYRSEIRTRDPDFQGAFHELNRNWFNSTSDFLSDCGIADLGNFRFGETKIAEDNDFISKDDQNFTHGLGLGLAFYGTRGTLWATYDTKLWSYDAESGFTPPSNYGADPSALLETKDKTFFYELTDVRLKAQAPIEEVPGAFYRFGFGIQYFTNKKNWFGGAAQQRAYHDIEFLGSSPNDDVYGSISDFGVTASADIGMNLTTDSGNFFCIPEIGFEGSTNNDLSFLHFGTEAGAVVCRDSRGRSVLEVVSNFDCYQFANGERDTQVSLDAQINLIRGKKWDFQLICGAMLPLEQNDGLFHFTNDEDLIGRLQICLARRF